MSQENYDGWFEEVDVCVRELTQQLSVHDFADQPFRDWFEDGISPNEAAIQTLENEGFPQELLDLVGAYSS